MAEPDRRTPPVGPVPQRGKGGGGWKGGGDAFTPNPSPTHSQPSLGSLPQAQARPCSALRGSAGTTPPWAAETGSPGG